MGEQIGISHVKGLLRQSRGLASLQLAQAKGNRHKRHELPERSRLPRLEMETEGQ